MVVRVPERRDREDIVAYLASLEAAPASAAAPVVRAGCGGPPRPEAASTPSRPPPTEGPAGLSSPAPRRSATGGPTRPGVRRLIRVEDLPAAVRHRLGEQQPPRGAASVGCAPSRSGGLAGGSLRRAARGSRGRSASRRAVTSSSPRPPPGGSACCGRRTERRAPSSAGPSPTGSTARSAWPSTRPGPSPQWLYVAENNRLVRFPYRDGETTARGRSEVIVSELAPTTGGAHHAGRRLLARRQADVRLGGEPVQRCRGHRQEEPGTDAILGRGAPARRDLGLRGAPRGRAGVRAEGNGTGASSRPASATAWEWPSTRPRATCGARPTSATGWARTSSPTM